MTGSRELSLEVAEIEPRTSWSQADNAADICMATISKPHFVPHSHLRFTLVILVRQAVKNLIHQIMLPNMSCVV